MDIKIAAKKTKALIDSKPKSGYPHDHPSLGLDHILSMIDSIESGAVSGEKAHRWLGWIQCTAVFCGSGILDDMKAINHAA